MIRGLETKTLAKLRDHLRESGQRKSMFLPEADALEHPLEGDDEAKDLFDAVAESMYLMVAADGKIEDSEREVLKGALRELTQGALRSAKLDELVAGFDKSLKEEGQPARVEKVTAVLKTRPEAAEAAFILTAAVAFADDEIADEENEVLNDLADKLDISQERAEELLDELEEASAAEGSS